MKFSKIFTFTLITQGLLFFTIANAFLGSGSGSMPVGLPDGSIAKKAFSIGLGFNMEEILGEVEDHFHINKESARSVMERMNVAEQKGQAPEVDIFFNPSSPKFGEKITATAMPMYFKSEKSGMYYTWYLKHAKGKNKDLNGDGEIDIEDYKIEAMRIIANNGFKYEKVNYSTATDNDDDGYGPLKSFIQSGLDACKDEKGDKNCTRVPFGYRDSKEPDDGYRCYVQDFESGTVYEIVEASSSGSSNIVDSTDGTRINESGSCGVGEISIEDGNYCFNTMMCDSQWDTCGADMCRRCAEEGVRLWDNPEFKRVQDPSWYNTCVHNESIAACGGASEGKDSICTHLFPNAPGYTTGDKDFPIGEEEFWRTDPNDPSTANNQNTDEANVAGLGVDKFTWTYLPGDQVGVAVEGQSLFGTKHDDASSGTMWALANNIFDGKDGCKIENKGIYSKTIKGYSTTIPSAEININKCLKYNLVDPMKGGQPGNMETELSYFPTNPNKGDTLTMTANVTNNNADNSQLYYRWSVYGGDKQSLDMDDWTELSNDSNFRSDNNIKLLEGLGLDTFNMSLNDFNNKYLRIFVETEEYYNFGESQDTTKSGRSDVIVQVGAMSNNAMNLQVVGDNNSNICDSSGDNCQVLKNQVVEVTLADAGLRNFAWTLNGNPINYLQGDETAQGNVIRFPITGNPGDNYILNVTANDTSAGEDGNTGSKVVLTKNIKVVKSSIKLGPINNMDSDSCASAGGLTPLQLGTYNDISDSTTTADCSQSVFTATAGNITVPINYFPASIENSLTDIQWTVNGVNQDNGSIDLSQYPIGSTVSVSFSARYVPSNRDDLSQTWGVSQFDTAGKVLSDSIQIKIGTNTQQGLKKSSKIMAGLIYNLPIQMLFLLKMILTIIIIIFVSGVVMNFNKERV